MVKLEIQSKIAQAKMLIIQEKNMLVMNKLKKWEDDEDL